MTPDELYIDNHLLVLAKPAGMLSQADRTGDADLLSIGREIVRVRFNKPGNVYLGLVHRLDRPVSGVMVFARTSKAAARLAEQFRERSVDKLYLALVEGKVEGSGRCEDYLAKRNERVLVVESGAPDAKRAVLTWHAVSHADGLTMLQIRLETGRAHQIRVQLAHRRMPIVGDFRYGSRQPLDGKNLALHAGALALFHPTRKDRMTWTMPLPESWPAHIRRLSKRALETPFG